MAGGEKTEGVSHLEAKKSSFHSSAETKLFSQSKKRYSVFTKAEYMQCSEDERFNRSNANQG
jgi:hypothetical protein